MEIIVIGEMDNSIDHTFESANRIYGVDGLCPTLPTGTGGGIIPKILDIKTNGIVCSISLDSSEGFSLSCINLFKCLKANTHDLGIVERICKS